MAEEEAKKEVKKETEKPVAKADKPAPKKPSGQLCVVRVRGLIRVHRDIKKTLEMLHLYRKNYCTLIPNTPSISGMLKRAKDYLTWGEVDDATIKLLFEKRGSLYEGPLEDKKGKIKYDSRYNTFNGKKYKKYFRLQPPKGGFERKGIKKPFAIGGALGYRGKEINKLVEKMV